jgi:hypothetical protein
MRRARVLSAFAAALLVPALTSAQTVQLGARLDGAQEVPSRSTPGLRVRLAAVERRYGGAHGVTLVLRPHRHHGPRSGDVPSGPGAPAHVHAAAPGVNGGIVFPLFDVPTG